MLATHVPSVRPVGLKALFSGHGESDWESQRLRLMRLVVESDLSLFQKLPPAWSLWNGTSASGAVTAVERGTMIEAPTACG